ncbi:MAG: Tad domain-containing protein, partial [Anaerolineales bacterium]|nr:Tad domain-containing protein [Anaerolineales bacterium]
MKLWNLHLRNRRTDSPHRERGQSIAIIALALVGLLAFVGIAVDVGFLFARSTQLQAAVDSAALAGVTELVISKDAADQRAGQFLNANNIPISVTLSLDSYKDTTVIGEDEYSITVTWPVELFFLKLIGLDSYDLVRSATAAYFPQADIYASRRVDQGVVSTSNQSIFGPNICTSYGDPFSPFNSAWEPGAYTYHYRILLPPDYPDDVLRIELFDPDSINQSGDRDDVVFSAVATGINPTLFPPGTHEKLCQGG